MPQVEAEWEDDDGDAAAFPSYRETPGNERTTSTVMAGDQEREHPMDLDEEPEEEEPQEEEPQEDDEYAPSDINSEDIEAQRIEEAEEERRQELERLHHEGLNVVDAGSDSEALVDFEREHRDAAQERQAKLIAEHADTFYNAAHVFPEDHALASLHAEFWRAFRRIAVPGRIAAHNVLGVRPPPSLREDDADEDADDAEDADGEDPIQQAFASLQSVLHPALHRAAPANGDASTPSLRDHITAVYRRVQLAFERSMDNPVTGYEFREGLATKKQVATAVKSYEFATRVDANAERRLREASKKQAALAEAVAVLQQRATTTEFTPLYATSILPTLPSNTTMAAAAVHPRMQLVELKQSKLPAFGAIIEDYKKRSAPVEMLPNPRRVLLIEAPCAAEKTRRLVDWIVATCQQHPQTPVVCVSCRITHAHDLHSDLQRAGIDVLNYKTVGGTTTESKTEALNRSNQVIVSLQSINLLREEHFLGCLLILDEVRSTATVPASKTMRSNTYFRKTLRAVAAGARCVVAMDADLSADGAVMAFQHVICPIKCTLHVRLIEATLKRTLKLSINGRSSGGISDFWQRLKLECLRVRPVSAYRDERMAHRSKLRRRYFRALHTWCERKGPLRVTDEVLAEFNETNEARRLLPLIRVKDPEQLKVQAGRAFVAALLARRCASISTSAAMRAFERRWTPVLRRLAAPPFEEVRQVDPLVGATAHLGDQDGTIGADDDDANADAADAARVAQDAADPQAFAQRRQKWVRTLTQEHRVHRQRVQVAIFDRPRILFTVATTHMGDKLRRFCQRNTIPFQFYQGSTSDYVKMSHFMNTSRHWLYAAVVIMTSTATVAINVRLWFAQSFLNLQASHNCATVRDLFQQVVRIGRDENDPLRTNDVHCNIDNVCVRQLKDMYYVPQRTRFTQEKTDCERTLRAQRDREVARANEHALQHPGGVVQLPAVIHRANAELDLSAWNLLESQDQCDARILYKVFELCALPTRQWPCELAAPLEEEDVRELEELQCESGEAGVLRKTDDESMSEEKVAVRYDEIVAEWKEQANASGTPLHDYLAQWLQSQESASHRGREQKSARGQVESQIFHVARRLVGGVPTTLSGDAFVKLHAIIEQLEARAYARNVDVRTLSSMFERARQDDQAPDPECRTTWVTYVEVLRSVEALLGLSHNALLRAQHVYDATARWIAAHNRIQMETAHMEDNELKLALYGECRKLKLPVESRSTLARLVEVFLQQAVCYEVKLDYQRVDRVAPAKGRARILKTCNILGGWSETEDQILLRLPAPWHSEKVAAREYTGAVERRLRLAGEVDRHSDLWRGADATATVSLNGVHGYFNRSPDIPPFEDDYKWERYNADHLERLRSDVRENALAYRQAEGQCTERLALIRNKLGPTYTFKSMVVLPVTGFALNEVYTHGAVSSESTNLTGMSLYELDRLSNEAPLETLDRMLCLMASDRGYLPWFTSYKMAHEIAMPNVPHAWYFHKARKCLVVCVEFPAPEDMGGTVQATPTQSGEQAVDNTAFVMRNGSDLVELSTGRFVLSDMVEYYAAHGMQATASAFCLRRHPDTERLQAEEQTLSRIQHSLRRRIDLEIMTAMLKCDTEGMVRDGGFFKRRISYEQRHGSGRRYAAGLRNHRCVSGSARSTHLQSWFSDARGVLAGPLAFDVDLENSDFWQMLDLYRDFCTRRPLHATTIDVSSIVNYVQHRDQWLQAIAQTHGLSDLGAAKRLPIVVCNGGTYATWLREQHQSTEGPFYTPIQELQQQIHALRWALSTHEPWCKRIYEAELCRLQADGSKQNPKNSAFSKVLQTRENDCLREIDKCFYDNGIYAHTLIFDGMIVSPFRTTAPKPEDTLEQRTRAYNAAKDHVERVLVIVNQKMKAKGFSAPIRLKPLTGPSYETPDTLVNAEEALEEFRNLPALEESDGEQSDAEFED